ncbi:unnamed protein product [Peniophora sp. CBMAI 1063]|nr:unnamed protein product [Peniophora sp. CBMAI 1063]
MSNEYVEDSEPEREYIRMSQKSRSKSRVNAQSSPESGSVDGSYKQIGSDNRNIIDISSDMSGVFASPATPARKVTVKERIIDISDSPENSFTSPGVPAAARVPLPVIQSPIIDLSPIRPSKLGMYSNVGAAQPIAGLLNAKKKTHPSLTTSTTSEAPKDKPLAKRGRPAKADVLGDLSDRQLAGLLKCVCCDIKWTTRKSSAQKASHISSCARKHDMTALTVQGLVRKEIDNAPPAVSKSARTAKDTPLLSSQVPTHLEDIVNRAEPKKRGRRPAASATVQAPSAAHSDILDRARAVLHRENAPVIGPSATSRRPLSTSGHASPQRLPEVTQPFAKSALAGRGRSLFFADREENVEEEPPATQPFGASKFGALSRLQAPAPIASSSAISVSSSSSPDDHVIAVNAHSANEPSPRAPRSTKMSPQPDAQPPSFSPTGSDYFEYANDDFYNVQPGEDDWHDAPDPYDPETRYTPPVYLPQPIIPILREQRAHPGPIPEPASSANPNIANALFIPAAVRKPTKKRTKKAAPAVVLDDDALEVEMKRLILADEALYLRILRFEPIHFDVFYELALSIGISDRKLKARVRTILDKQVISHYGAEPGGKRTRKQYHP